MTKTYFVRYLRAAPGAFAWNSSPRMTRTSAASRSGGWNCSTHTTRRRLTKSKSLNWRQAAWSTPYFFKLIHKKDVTSIENGQSCKALAPRTSGKSHFVSEQLAQPILRSIRLKKTFFAAFTCKRILRSHECDVHPRAKGRVANLQRRRS